MYIRKLTRDDAEPYIAFRHQMWPLHDAAGYWDVVLHKYFLNPHAENCPESGLYGCLDDRNNLCGIAGAYPMPMTVNGEVHPGHMLVDWAVHPRYWTGPGSTTGLKGKYVAAKLFAEFMGLPGMKFASHGTAYSQIPLQRVAKKIPATVGASLLNPIAAALLECFHLRGYAVPSPISSVPLNLKGRASTVSPEDIPAAAPASLQNVAYVARNGEFWKSYFDSRPHHGATAILLGQHGNSGHIILNILECGRFRFGILLALHVPDGNSATARRLGASARQALRALRIQVLIATEADDCFRAFLHSLGYFVTRRPAHWWIIPKKTDPFCAEDVHWWLTSAERDAIWWPGSQVAPLSVDPQRTKQSVQCQSTSPPPRDGACTSDSDLRC